MKLPRPAIAVKTWALWVKQNQVKASCWAGSTLIMLIGTPLFTPLFQAGFLADPGQSPVEGVESWLLGWLWSVLVIAAAAMVLVIGAMCTESWRYERMQRRNRAKDATARTQAEEMFLQSAEYLFESRGVNTLEATVRAHDLLDRANTNKWRLR